MTISDRRQCVQGGASQLSERSIELVLYINNALTERLLLLLLLLLRSTFPNELV